MQTVIAALIVFAALAMLALKVWRGARAGTSCSCGDDCQGCDGCPALQAVKASGTDGPAA